MSDEIAKMRLLEIFVVYHRNPCDEWLIENDYAKYMHYFAVNEMQPKLPLITDVVASHTNEWDLLIYDKRLQRRNYRENSVFYHLSWNWADIMQKTGDIPKYIGIMQYDMKIMNPINPQIICDEINSLRFDEKRPIYVVQFPVKTHWQFSYKWLFDLFLTRIAVLLDMKYEPEKHEYCALLNTFIAPSEVFQDLCDFYVRNEDELDRWRRWIVEKELNPIVWPGLLERVTAMFLWKCISCDGKYVWKPLVVDHRSHCV